MCTVKNLRARFAKVFDDHDDSSDVDEPISPFDTKEPRVPASPFDITEPARPTTPEQWPTYNYPTMQCGWMPAATNNYPTMQYGWMPAATTSTTSSTADPIRAASSCNSVHRASENHGQPWRRQQEGWYSRRHKTKCEEEGGGSNSKPNPATTSANKRKKEAGKMTGSQRRAAERGD